MEQQILISKQELKEIIESSVSAALLAKREKRRKPERDYAAEVLEFLGEGPASLSDLRSRLKTSENRLYAAINFLAQEGKLEKIKSGRKVVFLINKIV